MGGLELGEMRKKFFLKKSYGTQKVWETFH
jgi:hypothetical protein